MYDKSKISYYICIGLYIYCSAVTIAIAKELFFGQTISEFISREGINTKNITITSRTKSIDISKTTISKPIGISWTGNKQIQWTVNGSSGGERPITTTRDYDTYRLCKAIGLHETNGCAPQHSGSKVNNCVSIMAWTKSGKRYIKPFKTQEESYQACVKLWDRAYGRFPDYALAVKYSGNDNAKAWLNNVTYFYNKLKWKN